jgi:hypothetical protein
MSTRAQKKSRVWPIIAYLITFLTAAGCGEEEFRKQRRAINEAFSGMRRGSRSTLIHEPSGVRLRCGITCPGSLFIDSTARRLEGLKGLCWLDISETKITDKALVSLAKVPDLEHLQIADCQITGYGIAALSGSSLKYLDVRNCRNLNANDLEAIKLIPSLKIVFVHGTALANQSGLHGELEVNSDEEIDAKLPYYYRYKQPDD